MARLNVKWYRRALQQHDLFIDFYSLKCGRTAVSNYMNDLFSTIKTLSEMPTIGRYEPSLSNKRIKFYSFVIHKRAKVFYRYNSRSIYVVAIQCTLMI